MTQTDTPIGDLLATALSAKYPIAVQNEEGRLVGILDRATIMAEVLEDAEETPGVTSLANGGESATETGADHRIAVTLLAPEDGFAALKQLASRVCDAVLAAPALPRGRIVLATFLAARATRHRNRGIRQIDLQFRVVIEDDAPSL